MIAPGALDMVNFGPPDTVPERFGGRLFYVHNPTVTLMRTTAEEMAELGRRIGRKAAAATGPAEVLFAGTRCQRAGRRRPAVLRPGGRRGAASRR